MSNTLTKEMLEQEVDAQRDKYLIFVIGNEQYGIEIRRVIEIVGIQGITEMPELPEYMKGIINLRGNIIPVIDVRLLFKKPSREYTDRTCIIVTDIKDAYVGLIVDCVSEVLSIAEQNVAPHPWEKSGFGNNYVKSIGKVGDDIKLILDCERVLQDDEMEDITEEIVNRNGRQK